TIDRIRRAPLRVGKRRANRVIRAKRKRHAVHEVKDVAIRLRGSGFFDAVLRGSHRQRVEGLKEPAASPGGGLVSAIESFWKRERPRGGCLQRCNGTRARRREITQAPTCLHTV